MGKINLQFFGGRGSSGGKGGGGGGGGRARTSIGTDGYNYEIGSEVSSDDLRITDRRVRIKSTGEILNFTRGAGELENERKFRKTGTNRAGNPTEKTTYQSVVKGSKGNYYAVQRTQTTEMVPGSMHSYWSDVEKVTRLTRKNKAR